MREPPPDVTTPVNKSTTSFHSVVHHLPDFVSFTDDTDLDSDCCSYVECLTLYVLYVCVCVCVSDDMALVMCGEGGPHYPGSYSSSLKDRGGGCRSMASSRYSSPPSFTADMVNAGATGIPGGLQQYRASIKPLMGYGELLEQQTPFLHRYTHLFSPNADTSQCLSWKS